MRKEERQAIMLNADKHLLSVATEASAVFGTRLDVGAECAFCERKVSVHSLCLSAVVVEQPTATDVRVGLLLWETEAMKSSNGGNYYLPPSPYRN